jgi:D-glycero-D-manno-heptose 1,7-bisphosphate phosphatase
VRQAVRKALFLDRDGVINREVGYLHRIEAVEFIEGVFETCRQFQAQDYLLFIVTNQAGIARQYYTDADFQRLTDWMLAQFRQQGIQFTKVYYSPFHPQAGVGDYRRESLCRKPNPGMILQAQSEFDIDLEHSLLVGDKESDIAAGIAAGVPINVLVRSGHPISASTQATVVMDSIQDLPTWARTMGLFNSALAYDPLQFTFSTL